MWVVVLGRYTRSTSLPTVYDEPLDPPLPFSLSLSLSDLLHTHCPLPQSTHPTFSSHCVSPCLLRPPSPSAHNTLPSVPLGPVPFYLALFPNH